MKACPKCNRQYLDDTLNFCLDDGEWLRADGETLRFETPGSPLESATRPIQIWGDKGNSIAVLPFANISTDASDEYFCDGLAEELLNGLSRIENLGVAARTSSFSFKGSNKSVNEIAAALSVKNILEGSVRRSGTRLRISVQLVDARQGHQLWSERYDREMRDIFDLQDEITAAVVDALKIKLLGENTLQKRGQHDLAAYELYLKGRYHLAKLTPADMQKSMDYLQQAVEADANFALAYATLAELFFRTSIAGELPPDGFFPKAKAAARRAAEIDIKLSEAQVALAWIAFWYDWDWERSENHCRRALELNANGADAHTAYAHLLSNTGRHAEAISQINFASQLDPLSLFVHAMRGQILFFAGETDEALTVLNNSIELEPNFWLFHHFLSSVYFEKRMFDEAVKEARLATQQSSGSTQAMAREARALAASGAAGEARKLLNEILRASGERYVPPYHLAQAYQALGDDAEALDCLEKGFEMRDVKMVFLGVELNWKGLRSDARFVNLLDKMKLDRDKKFEAGKQ